MTSTETTPDNAPWPSPFRAWYAVAVLLVAYTLSFADRMVMSLLIGPIRGDLNVSDTQVSLLIGFAFALFYTLMGLPFGILADRFNRKWLILFGLIFWCTMTALCGVAGSFWLLFLARMGVGVGEAALSPSAYSMLSDYFPKDRLGRAISTYSLGIPIGSGLALMLGGLVVQAVATAPPVEVPGLGTLASWRVVFLMLSLPGIFVGLLLLTLQEPVRRDASGAGRTGSGLGDFFAYVVHARAAVGVHIAGVSLMSMALFGAMSWIPAFLTRTYGMAPGQTGLWFGAVLGVTGVAGLLIGGSWADRQVRSGRSDGHVRTTLYGAAGLTPFLVAAPLMPNAPLALAVMSVGFVFAFLPFGVAGAALQLIAPNRLRGKVTALYVLCTSMAGLGLGPTVFALITDYVFGDEAMLRYSIALAIAVIMPVSVLLLALARKPYRALMQEASA